MVEDQIRSYQILQLLRQAFPTHRSTQMTQNLTSMPELIVLIKGVGVTTWTTSVVAKAVV